MAGYPLWANFSRSAWTESLGSGIFWLRVNRTALPRRWAEFAHPDKIGYCVRGAWESWHQRGRPQFDRFGRRVDCDGEAGFWIRCRLGVERPMFRRPYLACGFAVWLAAWRLQPPLAQESPGRWNTLAANDSCSASIESSSTDFARDRGGIDGSGVATAASILVVFDHDRCVIGLEAN